MNMQDAFVLANQAAKVPGVMVHSLGRYVPPHMIKPDTPWKVCVRADSLDQPCVITNEAELRLFVDRMHAAEANATPAAEGMLF